MAQRDLRRFLAYASIAGAGATLFGIAAFTPQGLAGAMLGTVARGLAGAILVGVAAMLDKRLRTVRLAHLAGLRRGARHRRPGRRRARDVAGRPLPRGPVGATARAARRVRQAPRARNPARGGDRDLVGRAPARRPDDAPRQVRRGVARLCRPRHVPRPPPGCLHARAVGAPCRSCSSPVARALSPRPCWRRWPPD